MHYNEYTVPGVTCREDTLLTTDGVTLKIVDFTPPGDTPDRPIVVFVAGLVSLITGWCDVLKDITPHYRTLYVETREKKSAVMPERGDIDFSVSRMTRDLDEFLHDKIPAGKPFCFVGSSLGSTIILDYLSQHLRESVAAILIAPNYDFRFPRWFILMIQYLPSSFYVPIKYILKWYLRNFRLDRLKEPEQVRKYEGTIDAAEPKRLKASALVLKDYTLGDRLPDVTAPVLVIGARTDALHGIPEMEAMVGLMPQARLVIMESNKETHSKKTGILIVDEIRRSA
jgi:pimeloyl-ACP methyl ester carboxylesterase